MNFKAQILFANGDPKGALLYFEKTLEIDPSNVIALIGKGSAFSYLGRGDESIAYYDKALEISHCNDSSVLLLSQLLTCQCIF